MSVRDNPLAYKVLGLAMEVYNTLGHGFLESAYGDSLEIELSRAGICYEREAPVPIVYKGVCIPTMYRADFIIDRRLIIENKAIKSLGNIERAQVIHYLAATRLHAALLINFGCHEKLQWEYMIPRGSRTSDKFDGFANAHQNKDARTLESESEKSEVIN